MNLMEAFACVEDPRRAEGRRYPLIPFLMMITVSIACGCCRYREMARFAEANRKVFQRFFNLKSDRMPSHVTIRNIMQKIDFEQLNKGFSQWVSESSSVEQGAWISIDGKAIRSTVQDYDKPYQNFVSLVSFFSQKQGQVLQVGRLENKKSSEIQTVQEMIKVFDLQGVNFTMDALHCQKNTGDAERIGSLLYRQCEEKPTEAFSHLATNS
jgi:hypothetical protein